MLVYFQHSHTALIRLCIVLVYFQYSHTALTRLCIVLVYFQYSHTALTRLCIVLKKQRCLVFVAVEIEVYFIVFQLCISTFQSAKLLSRVWLVQHLDIDVHLKCM